MKIKALFVVLTSILLSAGCIMLVNAQGTNIKNPTTDFGRDVKKGIDSTKNDSIAQQEQKEAEKNEVKEAQEDAEEVEAKEADEVSEMPEKEESSESESSENGDQNSKTKSNSDISEQNTSGEATNKLDD
jgi:preprotein translocase subunit SecF